MSSSDDLKIPYEKIKTITGNFDEANVIGRGTLGKVYKGKLSHDGDLVDVAVRRIDHSYWLQDNAFAKEIEILSNLKHKNLISLVGFCEENDDILVISKRVANASLYQHLSDPTLTWMTRLNISIGVATALKYMHNHNVIHQNVSSATILLDENWEAKLSGFECCMVIQEGLLDPVYERILFRSYKSDAFSFGVVLFELLCGTEASVSSGQDKPSLAIRNHQDGTLHELVDPDLFKQIGPLSFNIFSAVAYDCVNERRAPPNMNQVLERLEKAFNLQEKYDNNEPSSTVVPIGPSSERLKTKLKQLKHMRIPLEDIKAATKSFDRQYLIMSGGFGMVYKTKLAHVDREYCKVREGKNEQVPMKRSEVTEVAVKRILYTKDGSGEQGFYAEIDMLTSCEHFSIVTLFGFCNEGSEMILVYEYASNGSLVDYLRGKSNMTRDSWAQRMNICLQVAHGLRYLHTGEGGRQEIVHRDIKSANILLDENLDAKIGDFGLCQYYSVNEEHNTLYPIGIAGTEGYMDPQYAKEGRLRKELDIYCLGIVMFEMLCGRLAYDEFFSSGLATTARQHFTRGTLEEIVDIRMKLENREEPFIPFKRLSSFKFFSQIAFRCLAEAQADRPTLENVIKELHQALPFQVFFDKAMKLTGNKIPNKEPKRN